MADNVAITAGSGTTIASDDVGGVQYQRVKPTFGADGTAVDQAIAAAGIPKVGATDALGQAQYNFPAGFVRVTDEPRQMFYDPFDGAVVDVTNRWTAAFALGNAVTPSQASGQLVVNAGSTSTGWATLTSQPSFVPVVPAWIGYSFAINLTDGAALVSSGYRFWGAATNPATPTVAAPLTDAVGFEITGGKMYAVVYAAGVRTVIQDMSAATGNASAPTDALNHRYIVYVRTDRAYWYVDALTTPVATSSFQSPAVQTLPAKYLAVSGGAATTIQSPGVAVWDTGKNASRLSDGTYPWRTATVNATGALSVDTELPAAVLLADAAALPTTPKVGSVELAYNGATTDLVRTIDGFKTAAASPDVGLLGAVSPDRRYTAKTLATPLTSVQSWDVNGAAEVAVHVASATTGTFKFQVSADGTNYADADAWDAGSNLWIMAGTLITPAANKVYRVRTVGWRNLQVLVNGTLLGATVNFTATLAPHVSLVSALSAPPPHNIGYAPTGVSAQYTTAQTSTTIGPTVAATQRMVVTSLVIEAAGTVAATQLTVYFGTGAFSRGTSKVLYDGSAKPSATLIERILTPPPVHGWYGALDEELKITNVGAVSPLTIGIWYYLVG